MIRRAEHRDIDGLNHLLLQVHKVHADARPDIFQPDAQKYTKEELSELLGDELRPIFVFEENGQILGHAFCVIQTQEETPHAKYRKTFYVDDICVDEKARRHGIVRALYGHVVSEAKKLSCHCVTLNVWNFNEPAMAFYKAMGMKPLKTVMEEVL